MPGHPDMTPEASENMIEWILKKGADPNLNYLAGKERAFTRVTINILTTAACLFAKLIKPSGRIKRLIIKID
jgi:hypothetical protein